MRSLNIPELCLKQLSHTHFVCVHMCAYLLSHVQFLVTPWTIAHQACLYSNNN